MNTRPETAGPRGRGTLTAVLVSAASLSLALAPAALAGHIAVSITAGTGTVLARTAQAGDLHPPCVREDAAAPPTVCGFTVDATEAVTLDTALDEDRAVQWAEPSDCGAQESCTVLAGAEDRQASVAFTPGPANLTIVPNMYGSIDVVPEGAPRGATDAGPCVAPTVVADQCSYDFPRGTTVTLTPHPDVNAGPFVGWSPFECEGLETCVLTLDQGATTAEVSYSSMRLRVSTTSGVEVTGDAAGVAIDCGQGNACDADVQTGTVVTLTGTPIAGETRPMHWWQGCEEGTDYYGPTCTAVVTRNPWWVVGGVGDEPPSTPPTQHVTFTVRKSGGGSVRGGKLDCGRICSHGYDYGTPIALVADADPGWGFDHWVRGCGGKTTCHLTLGPTTSVRAIFSPRSSTASVSPPAPPGQPAPQPTPPPLISHLKARVTGTGSRRRLVLAFDLARPSRVGATLRRAGGRRRVASWPTREVGAGHRLLRLRVPRRLHGTFRLAVRAAAGGTVVTTTASVRLRR